MATQRDRIYEAAGNGAGHSWQRHERIMTADRPEKKPMKVLLLDDRHDNLILRSAILRSNGYEAISSASVEEAETHLDKIDIAVLDYHLGAGKFGTEVAQSLRDKRPEV